MSEDLCETGSLKKHVNAVHNGQKDATTII